MKNITSVRVLAVTAFALALLAGPSMASAATLTRQLDIGMSGADVSALQAFLAKDSTIYPQGLVTGYFGHLTQAAVTNFQSRNGIDSVGRVGPITMAALNAQMDGMVFTGVDVSAPAIFGVMVSARANGATISWSTSELARGTVYHGTTPLSEYELPHSVTIGGTATMTDTELRTSQIVSISGLLPNTTYYYDIYATDAMGNASMTLQTTFRTLAQ